MRLRAVCNILLSVRVDALDTYTPGVDLDRLRTLTRYRGYAASTAVGISDDEHDLPRNAARDGIDAFTGPLESHREEEFWGDDAVATGAGPTILKL